MNEGEFVLQVSRKKRPIKYGSEMSPCRRVDPWLEKGNKIEGDNQGTANAKRSSTLAIHRIDRVGTQQRAPVLCPKLQKVWMREYNRHRLTL